MIDLELKKGDIVSIVGAGGKTTLLNFLAAKYSKNSRVLMTTTTKIYPPTTYDYFYNDIEFIDTTSLPLKNGLYVVAPKYNNKLSSLSMADLNKIIKYFDYIFIEADGAKMKPLKGWNKDEPVIYDKTTITIGVLEISYIGSSIDKKFIHRVDIFCELVGKKVGDRISLGDYKKIIWNRDGMFKNAKGKRVVCLNSSDLSLAQANSNTNILKFFLKDNNITKKRDVILLKKKYNDNNDSLSITSSFLIPLEDERIRKSKGNKITAIVLASGCSRRMGKNKLLLLKDGMPIIEHLFIELLKVKFSSIIVVTQYKEIDELAKFYGYEVVRNLNPKNGISESIKLGVNNTDIDSNFMFFTGDQPDLKSETIENLIKIIEIRSIVVPRFLRNRKSPVIFCNTYREELLKLNGDVGGKEIIRKNIENIKYLDFFDGSNFLDIDTIEEYEKIR